MVSTVNMGNTVYGFVWKDSTDKVSIDAGNAGNARNASKAGDTGATEDVVLETANVVEDVDDSEEDVDNSEEDVDNSEEDVDNSEEDVDNSEEDMAEEDEEDVADNAEQGEDAEQGDDAEQGEDTEQDGDAGEGEDLVAEEDGQETDEYYYIQHTNTGEKLMDEGGTDADEGEHVETTKQTAVIKDGESGKEAECGVERTRGDIAAEDSESTLPVFDPASQLPAIRTVAIYGSRNAGKTVIMRHFLEHLDLDVVTAFIPQMCTLDEFREGVVDKKPRSYPVDAVAVNNVINTQRNIADPKRIGIVLDDCLTEKTMETRWLFMNSRHSNLFFMHAAQFPIDMGPAIRASTDLTVLFGANISTNARLLPHLPCFLDAYELKDAMKSLRPHEALVFDRRVFTSGDRSRPFLFRYLAPHI